MAGIHWNQTNLPNPETTTGAQAKANQALADAKAYTDSKTSAIPWGNVTGKPSTFPPSSHTHSWSEITGAPDTATRWPSWSEVTNKPSTFPPSTHNHNDLYYTKAEINQMIGGANKVVIPGDTILAEALTSRTVSSSSNVIVKSFLAGYPGHYRVTLEFRKANSNTGSAHMYVNTDSDYEIGNVGVLRRVKSPSSASTSSTSFLSLTFDTNYLPQGTVIYISLAVGGVTSAEVRNVRLRGNVMDLAVTTLLN